MASRVQLVAKKGLISPPKWLPHNVHYEVLTGSVAYGASSDTSDMDVVGFCIPPRDMLFPHLAGEIYGFGTQIKRFEQFQQHHINDTDANQEYDFTIYSIVKYFQLCMEGNPNLLGTLYVPQRCVLHVTAIGQMVRDNRQIFLSKVAYPKYRGYFAKQLHNISLKTSSPNVKRQQIIDDHGFDTKYAMHVLRLALECEQLLTLGDIDLEQNSEILKSVRRGEWSLERIKEWSSVKDRQLEDLLGKTHLPAKPDENVIKNLLLNCLEHHYGSLSSAVTKPDVGTQVLHDLEYILQKYR